MIDSPTVDKVESENDFSTTKKRYINTTDVSLHQIYRYMSGREVM